MAINYIQAFNSGEISRKMDGRSSIEIYQTGCRTLENFYVMPQGGVERRAGTELISISGAKGSEDGVSPVKLIPFDFSTDVSYVVELGSDFVKIHKADGTASYSPEETPTYDIPYSDSELNEVQFVRRFDTLILTHRNHEPLLIQRTTLLPKFEIKEIEFLYPPLLDKNILDKKIQCDQTTGTGATLTASDDTIFKSGHAGSIWAIDFIRDGENARQERTFTTNAGTQNYDAVNCSFANFSITTKGFWYGKVVVQIDEKASENDDSNFVDFVVVGNTAEGAERNVTFSTSTALRGNTRIRVQTQNLTETGAAPNDGGFTLIIEDLFFKGLVKLGTINGDSTQFTDCTIISPLQDANTDTIHWSEAAFSNYRKFPVSAEFYQNRLFFTGNTDEPSTIFGSVFNEIFSFLTGETSDLGIRRIVDTPEEGKYLLGKKNLFMGTTGNVVSVNSVDNDALISAKNINTQIENSYGSANVQPVIANDVIVYTQSNGLKLRELVYNQDANVFIGNDLNIMSEDITESGIVQMFVQKDPYQLIWCIKADGDACVLTYDRVQNLMGWAKFQTDGTITNGTSLPSTGEDRVWIVVNRGTDTAPMYCIERFSLRNDLDFYVDSGKEDDRSANQATGVTIEYQGLSRFRFLKSAVTGLEVGDFVRLRNFGVSLLNNKVYKLAEDSDDTYFVLKTIDGLNNISAPAGTADQDYTADVAEVINTVTGLDHLQGKEVQVLINDSYHSNQTVGKDDKGNDIGTGEIKLLDTYGEKITVGLKFTSTLRPMPLEPAMANTTSQARVKATSKMVVRFLNTKGASVGEEGRQLTNFPVVDTLDKAGKPVALTTGQQRFFIASDYEREKLVEVRQDLPYPMTVLSIATEVNMEGM